MQVNKFEIKNMSSFFDFLSDGKKFPEYAGMNRDEILAEMDKQRADIIQSRSGESSRTDNLFSKTIGGVQAGETVDEYLKRQRG